MTHTYQMEKKKKKAHCTNGSWKAVRTKLPQNNIAKNLIF